MGNIILLFLIIGYSSYLVYQMLKKRNTRNCCEECGCPIKNQQKRFDKK